MIRLLTAALAAVFVVLLTSHPRAHDIPSDVRIQMFVKPEGQRMRVLVRVPLASIVETAWPERGPGILDIAGAEPLLREGAVGRIGDDLEVYEGARRLDAPRLAAVKASLPSDRSFDSYDQALAHVTGPSLPQDTEFVIVQGMLDVLFEYAIQSDRSAFSVRPNYLRLGVTVQTELQFLPPEGPSRGFSLHNDPGLVHLDPNWMQVARRFVRDGFLHIPRGADHLLFLFVLIIPFLPTSLRGSGSSAAGADATPGRRGEAWRAASVSFLAIITSFTVAHSVALIASAYGMTPSALWFPAFVNALIAASILYVALENLIEPSLRRRWMAAFGFGLAHGFGFASELRDSLQFAGGHFLTSLLSFNVGLEFGQLAALIVMVPALALLFRFVVPEQIGTVILSLLVAHTGWHWTIDRYNLFRRYQFIWPVFDAAFFVIVIRWLMVATVLAGLAWLIFGALGQRKESAIDAENANLAGKN
jgi:hypothetical protein